MSEKDKKEVCVECDKEFDTLRALKTHTTMAHKRKMLFADKKDEANITPLAEKKEKMFEIEIFHVEGELDYVYVNGSGKDVNDKRLPMRIQRGKKVKVPEIVVNILRDAVVKTYKYEPDGDIPGQYKRTPVTYTKYPMNVRELAA